MAARRRDYPGCLDLSSSRSILQPTPASSKCSYGVPSGSSHVTQPDSPLTGRTLQGSDQGQGHSVSVVSVPHEPERVLQGLQAGTRTAAGPQRPGILRGPVRSLAMHPELVGEHERAFGVVGPKVLHLHVLLGAVPGFCGIFRMLGPASEPPCAPLRRCSSSSARCRRRSCPPGQPRTPPHSPSRSRRVRPGGTPHPRQ